MMNIYTKALRIASWNIAAINNNPFEYWITYKENPAYEQLMNNVERFIENPGHKDVKVDNVFTEEMFTQLDQRLTNVGWKSVRNYWEDEYKDRQIIETFMKDSLLGSKRLASMPDRMTNTINTEDMEEPIVFRPTVINMYDGDLSTQDIWYNKWETFMFDTTLKMKNDNPDEIDNDVQDKKVYELLQPILKAKYPDITEQESEDSLPLQTLCLAIFDAILVHMMNTVSTPESWQPLKTEIVDALNKKKIPRTLEILATEYIDSDIVTLTEVSTAFINQAKLDKVLHATFHIVAPKEIDSVRDQNSVIFLNRKTFPGGSLGEITDQVTNSFPEDVKVPVSKGDILAIKAVNVLDNNLQLVVAAFHGDTNGLATVPVLDAVVKAMKTSPELSDHGLIFGLDANTYENTPNAKKQNVMDFGTHYQKYGLASCWGDDPQPSNYTTYNARTYLQPQLNKACRSDEKRSKGDVNPKDFILFIKADYKVVETTKDNTGTKGNYIEDMAFPTLTFPSDHGVISTIIERSVGS